MSRRANSANPRRAAFRDLDGGIAACAAAYGARGQAIIFRVPSFVEPALDRRLEAMAYTREGETITLHGTHDTAVAKADPNVAIRPKPEPEWLAAMSKFQGYSPAQSETYRRIALSVTVPAAFAGFRLDGEYVALAFGILDGDIYICESVIASAAHRRRGYGQRTLAALHRWALDRGARHFCLQVEATNAPAVRLYRGLGLDDEIYRYHYRRAP